MENREDIKRIIITKSMFVLHLYRVRSV